MTNLLNLQTRPGRGASDEFVDPNLVHRTPCGGLHRPGAMRADKSSGGVVIGRPKLS
jgi:hypothetical protein